jgi:NADH-quinone oxidoreductase subunit J
MNALFYIASIVAIAATIMVITRLNAIHALLYLIVSLLSVAVIFFLLGAPFVAALEVIVYAGAIMVLFVFVVMMLNLGPQAVEQENRWFNPKIWIGPAILSAILIAEFIYVLILHGSQSLNTNMVNPKQVGISLFSTYLLGVELASMLLLAGIIGAYHLGRRKEAVFHRYFRRPDGISERLHPAEEGKIDESGIKGSDKTLSKVNVSGMKQKKSERGEV